MHYQFRNNNAQQFTFVLRKILKDLEYQFTFMRTLSENQIKVLKLYRSGKKPTEICNIANLSRKSVNEAIRRGEGNIQRAIEILRIASENGGLKAGEAQKLKEILRKS